VATPRGGLAGLTPRGTAMVTPRGSSMPAAVAFTGSIARKSVGLGGSAPGSSSGANSGSGASSTEAAVEALAAALPLRLGGGVLRSGGGATERKGVCGDGSSGGTGGVALGVVRRRPRGAMSAAAQPDGAQLQGSSSCVAPDVISAVPE
jgi:hypothetical protein